MKSKYRLTTTTARDTNGITNPSIEEAIYNEYGLTEEQIGELDEHSEVFSKMIFKLMTDYQMALSLGEMRGKENEAYAKIDVLKELAEQVQQFPEEKMKYEKKIQEELKSIKDKTNS